KHAYNFGDFNIDELKSWWFTRMIHTAAPFEEKITLFWHSHFATANSKVDNPIFMYLQNLTLRKLALGTFDNLLLAIAQDPAMLVWLDGVTNVAGNPNENFARELQELFTMGITDVITGEANYTQTDVHEIARAFTGWGFYWPNYYGEPFDIVFAVNPNTHDNGPKTIYGVTADYDGEDVLQLIAAREATARFLVSKFFDYFVYSLDLSTAADQQTVQTYAGIYMNSGHSILAVLQAIFTGDEFFSDRARFALVKSPAEFVVGSILMPGAIHNPGTSVYENGGTTIQDFATLMGQELFNPPNVGGWPVGIGWVNTASALGRYGYADYIATNRPTSPGPGAWIDPGTLSMMTSPSAADTVANFASRLGPLPLDSTSVTNLTNYLMTLDNGSIGEFKKNASSVDEKVRGLVHLIMSLPEYQLN
ncbi:MAG TPA: DUF1800 domain-containing protein, partial [Blastocatellia bacterium]